MSDSHKGQYLKAAADVMTLKERIKQLEQELADAKKDQARYKFVRDMPSEDFGNLSTNNDAFDCQIDAAIKESSK